MAKFSTLAASLRYGHSLWFACRIEGIPVIFTEHNPTGNPSNPPTGYTLDPSLILDDSPPIGERVDRREGLGQAFDLTVKLSRTQPVIDLMKRPSAVTNLVANLDPSHTAGLEVESTASFPASGSVYVGRERIDYTSKGTQNGNPALLGLTRGAPGGDWRRYEMPTNSTIAAWVADAPTLWRGREVTIWAYYSDPAGANHEDYLIPGVGGTSTGAACVWRGHIHDHPAPDADGWAFRCRSYGRKLAEPVGTPLSGDAFWGLDDDAPMYNDPSVVLQVAIFEIMGSGLDIERQISPFTGLGAYGTPIRGNQIRDAIKAAWDAEFTGDANIGALSWAVEDYVDPGQGLRRKWSAYFQATSVNGGALITSLRPISGAWSGWMGLGWEKNYAGEPWNTLSAFIFSTTPGRVETGLVMESANLGISSVTIQTDDGDPSKVPASGWVRLDAGDASKVLKFTSAEVHGHAVSLQIEPGQGDLSGLTSEAVTTGDQGQAKASILWRDAGSYREIMLRMLMSSGRSGAFVNNATFDTLPASQGYDLPGVNVASFDALDGAWGLFEGEIAVDDELSFGAAFGGLLALSQRAIVPLSDGDEVKLTAVRTSVYDTAGAVTITDADLVTQNGSPAIRRLAKVRTPNAITVTRKSRAGSSTGAPVHVNDLHGQQAAGVERWSIDVIGVQSSGIRHPVASWGKTIFAEQGAGIPYEIDVPPWVDVQTGDAVRIASTSFRFVDPSTGALGYTGGARVIGRQVRIRDQVQTLTVILQGQYTGITLSPAMEILSISGSGGAGDVISVPAVYYDLAKAYLEGVPLALYNHHAPGEAAATGDTLSITAVNLGTDCELTIGLVIGGTLAAGDFLTLPASGSSNPAQLLHLHTDTAGAVWR